MELTYPNLAEVITYHPYNIRTFAEYADVTVELLRAGIIGKEEELDDYEIYKIAKYTGLPYTVLSCKKMIYLQKERYRHRQMIEQLFQLLDKVWEEQKKGSREAERYMKYGRDRLVNLDLDFRNRRKVTYGRYLGVLTELKDALLFISAEKKKKPRDIKRKTA